MAASDSFNRWLEVAERPGHPSVVPAEFDADQGRALLAAHYADFLLEVARAKGVDTSTLFGDEPVFATRGRRAIWSHKDLGLVSHNLQLAMDDELWGLAQGCRVPPGTFRFACELFLLSVNLGEALGRAFRLYDLFGAIRFQLHEADDQASICISAPSMPEPHAAFVIEWHLWIWRHIAQWFIGSEIRSLRIEFPHAPRVDPPLYDGTFGSRSLFGAPAARLVFSRQSLARRITRSAQDLEKFLQTFSVTLQYAPYVRQTVSTELRRALVNHLQSQKAMPRLQELAAQMGVSDQTLRRKLAAEGVSYRTLKAEVRSVVSRQYLARPGMTVTELAGRAGFADTTAFTRAFRGWTGMSVSQFRQAAGSRSSAADEGADTPS